MCGIGLLNCFYLTPRTFFCLPQPDVADVLLIDRDPVTCADVTSTLAAMGYTCEIVDSYARGVALAAEEHAYQLGLRSLSTLSASTLPASSSSLSLTRSVVSTLLSASFSPSPPTPCVFLLPLASSLSFRPSTIHAPI